MEEKELGIKEDLPAAAIGADDTLPKKITKEDFKQAEMTTKGKVLHWVRLILLNILSSFLIAFTVHCLITPNDFTIGGISGIAILIHHEFPVLQQSIIVFCLNVPLLILAVIYLKRKFAIMSIMNILLQSLWLFIFEQCNMFTIDFSGGAEANKIFAAIAAGLCFGTAIALAYKIGSSTGGGDIMAVLIQRKIGASSIAWILLGINAAVIGASFFVFYDNTNSVAFNLLPIMLSIFESYIESKANEFITNGSQSAREFRIITDKPEEMAKVLMKELSRGVTAIPATGMYTKITHTMVHCVVSRRQVAPLKRIVKQVDPDAFVIMSNASQVLGLGFYTGE